MRESDPIGIAGEAGAEHEYDGYADRAYVTLMDGQSLEAIAAYLLDAAADHMGLGRNERISKRSYDVAKRLIEPSPSVPSTAHESALKP
jgi:hypothetical protein